MISLPVIFVLLAAVFGSVGQLMFKKVSSKGFNLLKDPVFYLAGFLYGLSAVIFIVSLKFEKLLILYPLISTSYVWTSLLAMKYLNEKMNKYKWGGMALIFIGILFIVK